MNNTPTSEKRQSPPNKRRLLVVLAILLTYLVAVIAAAVIVDGRHVRFYLSGPQTLNLEYGEKYSDPGVYAVSAGNLFGEGQKHLNVVTDIKSDGASLGSFEVVYTARYFFRQYTVSRTVNIVDTTPPLIELNHKPGYSPSWFTGYEEEGYTAHDNFDGDLSSKVLRTVYPDHIEYTVTDSSGNTATVERSLEFLDDLPTIILNGGTEITINASMNFVDPGFSAVDSHGNDISDRVEIWGEVTPYKAGTYEICYAVYNTNGEAVQVFRTVNVLPVNNPDAVDPDAKTIYLTFDDGPGPYTSALLDVLAKYNVKATFFVTAAYPKYYNMIGREYNEGHAVGVHTYSHDYRTIYSSEEAFFSDFNAVQDLIYEQTGTYTKLCRFPGGSSNTVSSFNKGIMSRLSSALTDMGYSYFDWNVSSGDAGETTKTDTVAQNIIDGCTGRKFSVVLQHDIKDFSVAAVEKVIIWGLNNGYTFRALDQTSPGAHHGIAN